jgi:putative ABC transport system substrate-binding protein
VTRRAFIRRVVTSALALAPLHVVAQVRTPVRRIGVLSLGNPPTPAELEASASRVALRDFGWIEDKNLIYERRYVGGRLELLNRSAEELVGLKVDLIVTSGTDAALAAKRATSTIPIIILVGDPVLVGLVNNLSNPGGNITGFSTASPELDAKRLELLRELIPGIQRVGELVNSNNPYYAARPAYERVYASLGLEPIFLDVRATGDIEAAVATAAQKKAQALVVPADNLFSSNPDRIMRAALRYRLPTIVEDTDLLKSGGLIAYTFNSTEVGQRYAAFVDKVLRGAKPGDLPIEQPTRFELVVNLRTARELGLVVPRSILTRANEVIQ